MFGSPNHKPLSSDELIAWAAHDKLTAFEREEAMAKAKRK